MSQSERYGRIARVGGGLVVALLALAFFTATPAVAQVDANGYVTSNNFLALGPFGNNFGCSGTDENLCNHLAPSLIQCQYPEEGDEVDYDPALACSNDYQGPLGPNSLPVWRLFNDGSDDCNNDMDADAGADISDVVTFLCTYVENDSADDLIVNLCMHSDDGIQVWLDDDLVWQNNACRGFGDCAGAACQDTVQVTLTEGIHRFIVGIWERAGGWGGSLGFQDEFGLPIAPGTTDLVYLGINGDGFSLPCVPPPTRTVTRLSDPTACPPSGEGPFSVVIQDTEGNAGDTVTVTERISSPLVTTDMVTESTGEADIEPLPAPDVGVQIIWSVERSVLQGAGVSYEVDLIDGQVNLEGDVAGSRIIGDLTVTLAAAPAVLGPFEDINLTPGVHGLDYGTIFGGCTAENNAYEGASAATGAEGLNIVGAGGDIWGQADAFMYVYGEVSGDFDAQVTVVGQSLGNNNWAKFGIMARANCLDGSAYANVVDCGAATGDGANDWANESCFQYRLTDGTDAQWPGVAGLVRQNDGVDPTIGHARRLRLTRVGNTFEGFGLDEGGNMTDDAGFQNNWVPLGSMLIPDAPETLQLGLCVTSHDGCNLVEVTFDEWEVDNSPAPKPPLNATCTRETNGDISVSWEIDGEQPGDIGPTIVTANGVEVGSLDPAVRAFTVEVGDLPAGILQVCVSNEAGGSCCGFFNGDELNINCGGDRLDEGIGTGIGDGRVWEEDSAANPSPFLVSGPNRANFAGGLAPPAEWDPMNISAVTDLGFTDEFLSRNLFATQVWNDGPVRYTIPVNPGCYDVTIYFAEGCCSDGCEDIADPQLSATNCRVFDVYINDELVLDQFSKHVEAQREIAGLLPNAGWGVAIARGPFQVAGEVIDILVDDLGGGNPPENASIEGISIVKTSDDPEDCGGPIGGPQFARGDADANGGAPNITDGIYVLNFLFLGGPPPPCRDAADADDNGAVNITDGIYVLNFLFLGGPPPPAPQAPTCGEDTTPSALTCDSFLPCE